VDAAPTRANSAVEWIVAAAFLIATVVVGSLLVRELRTVRAVSAAPAAQAEPAAKPTVVPHDAVSVPVLLLLDGRQLRVGQPAAEVETLLGTAARRSEQADRGALGPRLTRFYDYGGTRFVLVFEPFERNGSLRVAGIYIE
jgi:hypothetical protein